MTFYMKSLLDRRLLYPLLFALYPVLVLLVHNIEEIDPLSGTRSIVVVLVGTLLLWVCLYFLFRSWERAALLCLWFVLLFFTYGHIYGYFEQATNWLRLLGRHRSLLPIWLILALVGFWWLSKKVRYTPSWTYTLNVIGIVLISIQLVQLGAFGLKIMVSPRQNNASLEENLHPDFAGLILPDDQVLPDVYYIILDAYARQDELENTFGFENQDFIEWLQEKGFYVAQCSQSNYAQTMLSLGSTFNMNYLDELAPDLQADSDSRIPLRALIKHSTTRAIFEQLGYTLIAFESGYRWTQLEDVDIYLSPQTKSHWQMNNFEIMLMRTSAGLIFSDLTVLPKLLRPDLDGQKREHYQRIMFTLDRLEQIPLEINSPKFVFVHFLAPHGPHVFDAEGQQVLYEDSLESEIYLKAYIDEIHYLNKRLEGIIESIFENSPAPPIIIIQADHGHELASQITRMAILNAYYLPEGQEDLYANISPVNTFRLVFSQLFNQPFETLEDKSFFSYYQTPYEYISIANECIP